MACKIRTYISAVTQSQPLTEEMIKWIKWASNKADWFDPIVSREDEFFGKREHDKADDDKNIFNQKEGLIPRSLLRNKLFQDMEEEIY